MTTEKNKKVMSVEELLMGTPLLAFLNELASMDDDDLVTIDKPIQEGEVDRGVMNPFEVRLRAWCSRRKAYLGVELKALQEKARIISREGQQEVMDKMCVLSEYDDHTDRYFEFLLDSIKSRFPDVKRIAIREGAVIVERPAEDRLIVGVDSGRSLEGTLIAALAGALSGRGASPIRRS